MAIRLDQRITVLREVLTPDGMGGHHVDAEPLAEIWAHLEPLTGQERAAFGGLVASALYRCVICRRTDLRPDDRILWRGHAFNIRAVPPVAPRQRFMELQIELGVAL